MTRSVFAHKPKGWNETPAFAEDLVRGIFFAFKTPLKKTEWDVEGVFKHAHKRGWNIGLWIDLTFTTRYYQPEDVLRRNAEYKKFFIEGQQAPSSKQISEFIEYVSEYRARCPDRVIGIHCTHGLNRTGFLICAYLCKELELSVIQAFEDFQSSRPPGMYRQNMVNDLVVKYACKVSSVPIPKVSLPPWKDGSVPVAAAAHKPTPVVNGSSAKRSSPDGSGSRRAKASRWAKSPKLDANRNWRSLPSDRSNSIRDNSRIPSNSQNLNARNNPSLFRNIRIQDVSLKDFYRKMPVLEADEQQLVLEELRVLLPLAERNNLPGAYKQLNEGNLQYLSNEHYLISYLPPQGHSFVLFLDSKGKVHFIDAKSRVRRFEDINHMSEDKDKLFSTVLEGFLTRVSDRKEGQRICFEISDVLIHNGQSLAEQILTTRLKFAREVLSKQMEKLFKASVDGKTLHFEEMQFWEVKNADRMLRYDLKLLYPTTPYGFFFSPNNSISDLPKLVWVDAKLLRIFLRVRLNRTVEDNNSTRVEFHTEDDDSCVVKVSRSDEEKILKYVQGHHHVDNHDGLVAECKYSAVSQSWEFVRPSAGCLSECSHFVDWFISGAITNYFDSVAMFRFLMPPKVPAVLRVLPEVAAPEVQVKVAAAEVPARVTEAGVQANAAEAELTPKVDEAGVQANAAKAEVTPKVDEAGVQANAAEAELTPKVDEAGVQANAAKAEVTPKVDEAEVPANAVQAELTPKVDDAGVQANAAKAEVTPKVDEAEVPANAVQAELSPKVDEAEVQANADEAELTPKVDEAEVQANAVQAELSPEVDEAEVEANADEAELTPKIAEVPARKAEAEVPSEVAEFSSTVDEKLASEVTEFPPKFDEAGVTKNVEETKMNGPNTPEVQPSDTMLTVTSPSSCSSLS